VEKPAQVGEGARPVRSNGPPPKETEERLVRERKRETEAKNPHREKHKMEIKERFAARPVRETLFNSREGGR